jgi:hypothetical protein
MNLRPAGSPPGQVAALAVSTDLGLALAVVVHDQDGEVEGHELQYEPDRGWHLQDWGERPDVAAAAGLDPARANGMVHLQIGTLRAVASVSGWGYWAYLTRVEPGDPTDVEVLPSLDSCTDRDRRSR